MKDGEANWKGSQACATRSVVNFLEAHALELEQHSREGNQFCFYKHLKRLDLEGTHRSISQFIRDETGKLLRNPQKILEG